MKTKDHVHWITQPEWDGGYEYYFFSPELLRVRVLVKYAGDTLAKAIKGVPTFVFFDEGTARSFQGRFNRKDLGPYTFMAPEEVIEVAVEFLEGYRSERDLCSQIACRLSTDGPQGRAKIITRPL